MRTAIGLMGEQGYEGTSTRDIARAAEVSVAALYYHFPSKLDLLREFLHEAYDVVVARVAKRVDAAGDDPRRRLDAVVDTIIAANLHDAWAQSASQVAWRELGRLDEVDQLAIAKKRDAIVDILEQILRDGIKAKVFSTNEPRQVARAVVTLCMSTIDGFHASGASMDATIQLHQRFAAALADTPTPADSRGRRR